MGKSKADRIAAAAARLRVFYARSGCLRVPIEPRLWGKNWLLYKHGYELRFGARDRSELREIQGLLQTLGVETGRSYLNHGCPIVPVYGRQRVLRAVRDLRLRRSLVRAKSRPRVPRRELPARLAFTTRRQLDVAMRMYDRGPVTAREVTTTPAMLAALERQRLARRMLSRNGQKAWVLTPRGKEQTRHGRVALASQYRSGKRTALLKRRW